MVFSTPSGRTTVRVRSCSSRFSFWSMAGWGYAGSLWLSSGASRPFRTGGGGGALFFDDLLLNKDKTGLKYERIISYSNSNALWILTFPLQHLKKKKKKLAAMTSIFHHFHKTFMAPRVFCCMNIWRCNISKERTGHLLFNKKTHFILASCIMFLINTWMSESFIKIFFFFFKYCIFVKDHVWIGFRAIIKT